MPQDTETRTFHVRNSEKCYRFKPDAIMSHAPPIKGIYELVTFDEHQKPEVLFIGAAFEKTMNECLTEHLDGTTTPKADDLLQNHPNLYFDFIAEWDAKSLEDAKDVYWWLIQKNKPKYNDIATIMHSGRTGDINVIEED